MAQSTAALWDRVSCAASDGGVPFTAWLESARASDRRRRQAECQQLMRDAVLRLFSQYQADIAYEVAESGG